MLKPYVAITLNVLVALLMFRSFVMVSFQYKVFGVVQLFPVDKPQPEAITFANRFFDRHAMLVAFCSVNYIAVFSIEILL